MIDVDAARVYLAADLPEGASVEIDDPAVLDAAVIVMTRLAKAAS